MPQLLWAGNLGSKQSRNNPSVPGVSGDKRVIILLQSDCCEGGAKAVLLPHPRRERNEH